MADVQPFRGMRYSAQLIKDLGDLLCPPYDVISPELQGELHDRSPYNAVRLELGVELEGARQRDLVRGDDIAPRAHGP